jgi:hypothetical protein
LGSGRCAFVCLNHWRGPRTHWRALDKEESGKECVRKDDRLLLLLFPLTRRSVANGLARKKRNVSLSIPSLHQVCCFFLLHIPSLVVLLLLYVCIVIRKKPRALIAGSSVPYSNGKNAFSRSYRICPTSSFLYLSSFDNSFVRLKGAWSRVDKRTVLLRQELLIFIVQ